MKRIPFTVILILMFFAAYSSAITLKELKKYQAAIKNACPPEADCEDENQIMQPSEIEVEEKLGVKDCVAMAARAYARQKKISIAKNQKKANTVKIRRNALSSQEE
ncbi:hypothetical protein SAMN05720469_12739 [Fibrobacter intestinalis]|uniref:Uncharacterized protein n=2 Tax=Fibrobacter TaxID=832 RepID=A0A1M6WXK6_9BACT|nr:hypothetical protein SAMN05720469_12739 [Fibrobacter intestinalis]